jgi:MFS family permease
MALQVPIGWLSDHVSRRTMLVLCSAIGVIGAAALLAIPRSAPLILGLLFVWGGIASGIYPLVLSLAGDRFRGGDLVSVNAAMIMAYGLGAMVGPPLGGSAMDLHSPQGLFWLFVGLFAGLLAVSSGLPRRRSSVT